MSLVVGSGVGGTRRKEGGATGDGRRTRWAAEKVTAVLVEKVGRSVKSLTAVRAAEVRAVEECIHIEVIGAGPSAITIP